MDAEQIRAYCLDKKCVTEGFPFDQNTLVFKVLDKMFLLLNLCGSTFNVKCNPEYAVALRENYDAITPGYHMNKKYWNTVEYSAGLPNGLVENLIDHSYELVVAGLPKKQQALLLNA
jgi:predicted DNA-binding protein (MmcQ/YjbR family)